MKKIFLGVLAVFLLVVIIYFSMKHVSKRHEYTFYPMGGIPFTIISYDGSSQGFNDGVLMAKKEEEKLEKIFSIYRDDSELVLFNKVAAKGVVEVSPDLADLFITSKKWNEDTVGAFDVTITPLTQIWKEAAKKNELPEAADLAHAMSMVGSDRLLLIQGREFKFTKEGMSVDLGAIAKGAIVDKIAELLMAKGMKNGIINAGGDGRAFGKRAFTFGIQDPTSPDRDAIIGSIKVKDKSIVTSGDYRRYFEVDGKRYSHIIDPRNGMPADSLISVTVVASNATDADALATALSVLGREDGIKWLKIHPEFSALMIEKGNDGQLALYASGELMPILDLKGSWSKYVTEF